VKVSALFDGCSLEVIAMVRRRSTTIDLYRDHWEKKSQVLDYNSQRKQAVELMLFTMN